jgi:O-antigen/teichoic acid export membrane protein
MLRNGLYNILSAVVRLALGLLTVPLLIRIIGLESYGLWSLVSAIVAVVALAEAGLSVTTTVFVARDLADNDRAGLAQTVSIIAGSMVVVASGVAALLWFGAAIALLIPGLSTEQQGIATAVLQLGALVVWTRLMQQVLVGVEQAYNRYGLLNALLTAQAVLINMGMVLVAYLGGGLYGMMAWQAIAGALMMGAHAVAVWRLLDLGSLRPAWSWPRFRALGRYSMLTWTSALGGALFSQCDRLIVGSVLGVAPLAIYAAITNIVSQINILSALPVQPLLPHLGARASSASGADITPQLRQTLLVNASVAFALGGCLLMLAVPLMRALLGREITPDLLMPLWAAVIIYSLYSLNAVGYYVLLGLRAVWACTINVLLCGAISLAMIAVGAHYGGLLGAAVGNAGYLGTLYLTWRGMRAFQVPLRVWLHWLAFPLAWFATVCLVALTAPESIELRLFLLVVAIAGLGIWFLNSQRVSLDPLMRRLVARLK